jgi:hypothetical protein
MVEQAHLGTTRYTTLSLSVIHVPGNPINPTTSIKTLGPLAALARNPEKRAVQSRPDPF